MKKSRFKIFWCIVVIIFVISFAIAWIFIQEDKLKPEDTVDKIKDEEFVLPKPDKKGKMSLEEAISNRRSRRNFDKSHITIKALSQILWSAQGITDENKKLRSAPSAGALHPMEIFAVLPQGVYRYKSEKHSLERIIEGDKRKDICEASLNQKFVLDASVNIVITAVYERSSIKYKDRAERYCIIESGAIAENIHLQVETLELGTVIIGAFEDKDVQKAIGLKKSEQPMIVMPIGARK